jgi:hypothetical protein
LNREYHLFSRYNEYIGAYLKIRSINEVQFG